MTRKLKKRWRSELRFIMLSSNKRNTIPNLVEFVEQECLEAIRMADLEKKILK